MLYIFDLDSTLVKMYTSQPLPGTITRLMALAREGHALAVATNQSGVAFRAETQDATYPSASEMGRHLDATAAHYPPLQSSPWFVAIHSEHLALDAEAYAALADELRHANRTLDVRVGTGPDWRKPQPGMLRAACEAHAIAPADAVFVGDMETDQAAAAAAGIRFIYAAEFFGFAAETETE